MIRGTLMMILGAGFLLLLAHSWSEESRPERKAISRGPASNSVTEFFSENAKPILTADASREKIRQLEACYSSEVCDFPKTSSRSYQFALSEALAIAIAEHQTNFGPEEQIGRVEILNPEPIVQLAALKMLSSLPPSAQNLSALENGLRNTRDPSILADGIKELERYLGSPLEIEVQKIVEDFLSRETFFSAQQAVALVRPFINEHSHEEFRDLLRQLKPGAKARRLLQSALEEYELQRKGG